MKPTPLARIAVSPELAEELQEMVQVEIDPDALYTAAEAAIIIGVRGTKRARRNAMYQIPADRLPRILSGPNGGRIRWLGRDLLAYREGKREG